MGHPRSMLLVCAPFMFVGCNAILGNEDRHVTPDGASDAGGADAAVVDSSLDHTGTGGDDADEARDGSADGDVGGNGGARDVDLDYLSDASGISDRTTGVADSLESGAADISSHDTDADAGGPTLDVSGADVDAGALDVGADVRVTCQDRVVKPETGIFVNGSFGTDAGSCGDRQTPCLTIKMGLEQALVARKSTVYVARGTYLESIALRAPVRIEGAWTVVGTDWIPLCPDNSNKPNEKVLIQAPPTDNITVAARDLADAATLANLAIRSKDTAAPGESLYGVFVRSANVVLEDVVVAVEKGGDGTPGSAGALGDPGSPLGCASGTGYDGALEGTIGAGALPGTFDENGYKPSSGRIGSEGDPGGNGLASTVPETCVQLCYEGCGTRSVCTLTGAKEAGASCGKPGLAGCGGGGGKGGTPGTGGGSSVALYLWNAKANLIGGSLHAGDAGNGAVGGSGGEPASGMVGVAGANSEPCVTECVKEREPGDPGDPLPPAICTQTVQNGLGGGPGGPGGNGKKGGPGGGGSGGYSYAIYQGPSSMYVAPTTVLEYGMAGASLSNGAKGLSGQVGP